MPFHNKEGSMKLPHYIKITEDVNYGDSKLFRIRLNPKYKDDVGLIAHEYTHVKQWYTGFAFGLSLVALMYLISGREDYAYYAFCVSPFWKGLLYTFVKPCRLYLEVQAFAKQISVSPDEHREYYIKAYAKSLAESYDLSVSEEDAAKKLRARLK